MADEAGLGKSIEAKLVLSQKLAERKRRKQWYQQIIEKFFLRCRIMEA